MEAISTFTPATTTTHHCRLRDRQCSSLLIKETSSPKLPLHKSKAPVSYISCTLVNPSVKNLLLRNGTILLPKEDKPKQNDNVTVLSPSLSPPPPCTSLVPGEEVEESVTIVSPDSLTYESGFLGAVPMKAMGMGGGEMRGVHNAMSYLTRILSSKVYDVAMESPLEFAPKLSERVGANIWIKREDLQPVNYNPSPITIH